MALFGWLAYGVGSSIGRSLLDEGERSAGPVRTGTEDDFRKDEARFAEDEKRLNEADEKAHHTSRRPSR
jgi:hypothetical protein